MKRLNKITIIGVGLIGGSIGLALKNKRLTREVVGVGRRRSSMRKAVRLKAVDWATLDPAKGAEGADIVILATPVLSMARIVKKIAPFLKKGCIVTDVGSTKCKVIQEIENLMPDGVDFVGGHPMAGSEKKGVEKANKGLFKDSISILTKTKATGARPLKALKDLWSALGAGVVILPPEIHDRVVSQISHLPHMVVFSMLESIDKGSLRFASSGFYDTTRIASSDADVWRDIAISNRDEILKSLSKFKKRLSILEKAIRGEDSVALLRIFANARKRRETHYAQRIRTT